MASHANRGTANNEPEKPRLFDSPQSWRQTTQLSSLLTHEWFLLVTGLCQGNMWPPFCIASVRPLIVTWPFLSGSSWSWSLGGSVLTYVKSLTICIVFCNVPSGNRRPKRGKRRIDWCRNHLCASPVNLFVNNYVIISVMKWFFTVAGHAGRHQLFS